MSEGLCVLKQCDSEWHQASSAKFSAAWDGLMMGKRLSVWRSEGRMSSPNKANCAARAWPRQAHSCPKGTFYACKLPRSEATNVLGRQNGRVYSLTRNRLANLLRRIY